MLAVEFARFLGLEFTGRANITDIVNAVCATAAHTRVELAFVDELHNLNLATRSGAEVSDQLKYFAERLPATFVYAGIDVEVQGLFAGVRGRQIAGRFTVVPAAPFAYGTGAQRGQWRALIAALESLLRLHRHRTGSLVRLDEYLYRRSGHDRQPVAAGAGCGDLGHRERQRTDQQTATRQRPGRLRRRTRRYCTTARRGSRAMRKASTAVSSSLANTDTWDFDRLVIPSSQSSCYGKQQTATGPASSAYTSRTALLTKGEPSEAIISWRP